MEKKNDEKLIKVVIESYVIRNEDGDELYRTSIREGAERELASLREYYKQHSFPFKPSITQERAIIECKAIRKRYPKNFRNPTKAGKTFYKLYHNDDFVKELEHEPKALDKINACAYDVNWIKVG